MEGIDDNTASAAVERAVMSARGAILCTVAESVRCRRRRRSANLRANAPRTRVLVKAVGGDSARC